MNRQGAASPAKVLVVDDDHMIREVLAEHLAQNGFEPICAPDGEAALVALQTRPVDAMVLDLNLPGIQGRDVLHVARKAHPRLTILTLTSSTNLDEASTTLAEGATDFVHKPVHAGLFIQRLERGLREQADRDALEATTRQLDTLVRARTQDLEVANTRLLERNTELERLHAELQAKNRSIEKAGQTLLQQEKLASLGQLASGVAHEINNPLGYMRSNLSSLERELQHLLLRPGGPDGVIGASDWELRVNDVHALILETQDGVDRIAHIVKSLRDFSRPGGHQREPEDLHALVESTVHLCWNELRHRADVRLDLQPVPGLPCFGQELKQVILNLVMNASQAITPPGLITVRTGYQGAEAFVEVEDNGCGISQEIRGRIFDPFFTTKPPGEGTGLGLAIAWRIMEKHGGRIDIQSRPGEGSRFTLWLPLHPATAETARA